MDRVALTVVLGAVLFGSVFFPPPDAATDQPPSPAVSAGQSSGGQERGGALPDDHNELFSASGSCASCHTGMSDQSGTDVSIDSAWRSTIMANAARDPYWSASVRSEISANPPLQAVIEDKCATCHAPMARTSVAARGDKARVLGDGFFDEKNPLHSLATDGVSCTVCHQILERHLGSKESFSGGYEVDIKAPWGERKVFGPSAVTEDLSELMRATSGFGTAQTQHMKRSELCATCHTLYTPFVDSSGKVAGEFPEQTVYLEYVNSAYRRSASCRSCHMPGAKGAVPFAAVGGEPRQPFLQHDFVGGNVQTLRILNAASSELGVTASGQQFDRSIEKTAAQLRERTATLTVEKARVAGSRLEATVVLGSHVGHKFPAGFPSRRAWIRLTVADASGKAVFESGAVQGDGSIAGNDNDASPEQFEPHYTKIERADQVQIYEAILGDTDGNVTTTLLRAARYLKDNRLLPDGFAKANAPADIAVHGDAAKDGDFKGGGDRIVYSIDTAGAAGPFTVTAELLFQSIGYRWAQNLRRYPAPEIEQFTRHFGAVGNAPSTVASATVRVPAEPAARL